MSRSRRDSTVSSIRSFVPGSGGGSSHIRGGDQELSALYDYLLKVILTGPSAAGKSSLLYRLAHPVATPAPTSAIPTSPIPAAHPSQTTATSGTPALPYLPQTIGIDLHTHHVTLGDPASTTLSSTYMGRRKPAPRPKQTRIKLQLWDTAGTERFRAVGRSYYRASCAAIVVYDVCDRQSLRECAAFVRDVRVLAGDGCVIALVGNKIDVDDHDSSHNNADVGGGQERGYRQVTAEEAETFATRHGVSFAVEVSAWTGQGVQALFRKVASSVLARVELGDVDPGDANSGVHYGDLDAHSNGRGFGDDGSVRSVRLTGNRGLLGGRCC